MRLKKVNKYLSKAFVALIAGMFLFSACDDDDETTMDPDMPGGMLTVSDQTLSQNKVMISNVNFDQAGWIVVHASTAEGGPVVPDIISEPLLVQPGSKSNLEVMINDFSALEDGAKLWVMLHTDDGIEGEYEFDGASGFDAPITDENGDIVMTDITISAPSITVENQAVSSNTVTISKVNAAVDGWLVIHSGEATGPVLGQTKVIAGTNTDVVVNIGNEVFEGGEMLFPMLHIESPADGEYGFPDNGDAPEVFGEDVVVVGFETLALTGSITAEDQIVQGNTITAANLTVNADAWVVVHASNATNDGPQVPEIISVPVRVPAGSNEDVEIELTEAVAAGDVIYVMLHTDNGVIGEYEFDAGVIFDGPVKTESITVQAPTGSFTANNQTLSADGTITVESITVGQPSWVVVHRDDGTGEGFVAPGIISVPVLLEAGTTTDIEISFEDGEEIEDGERLWVMLHNDNGTVGEYEFDGANGFDSPIVFDFVDITVPATRYEVANNSTTAYLFTGNGLTDSSNPGITLTRGETYTFTINASAHPFYIKTVQGSGTGNAFNDGVTNNGAESGTITFTVPLDAPDTLFYNCQFHGGMTGTFTIVS
ncbi:hypothetical protein GCM10011506_04250 [Marivirga lumbricoides]|uniref:DUF7282 domain-containing protein n=1 Tax=Marivirga lumbricoides TaxID=1046115 RepID=A0ABQ1LAS8_9BACT|nr:hypothetical protein GCM10011506_04250 [Marivirga lumbricoides]